jgi:hypothetical protein
LDGCLGAHGPVAGGTNSTTFDATEGMVANLQSAATANVNVGLVSPLSGAITRTKFGTRAVCRVKMASTTNSRLYFGFLGANTIPGGNTVLATGVPGIIVGWAASDTNYTMTHNDASGTAVITNITGPIAKDANWHTMEINWADNATAINVIFDGVAQTPLTTDIPANTSDLWFYCVGQTTSTATAQTLLIHGVWVEFNK